MTNIRLLLPFTFTWDETRGNVRTRYTGASGLAIPLPLIQRITIVSERRLRDDVWVTLVHAHGSTRFRPGCQNLSKLLLISRIWGIPLEAREEAAPRQELRRDVLGPWLWALAAAALLFDLAAAVGALRGELLATPAQLAATLARDGVWQFAVAFISALSGVGLWRWMIAFRQLRPGASLLDPPKDAADDPPPGLAAGQ